MPLFTGNDFEKVIFYLPCSHALYFLEVDPRKEQRFKEAYTLKSSLLIRTLTPSSFSSFPLSKSSLSLEVEYD
jgi:hypothetical protein